MVDQSAKVTNIGVKEEGRRAGDLAFLCANVKLINNCLGFVSNIPLSASCQSLFDKNIN